MTPNLPEASMLLDGASVGTLEEMRKAAAEIHKMGPRYGTSVALVIIIFVVFGQQIKLVREF